VCKCVFEFSPTLLGLHVSDGSSTAIIFEEPIKERKMLVHILPMRAMFNSAGCVSR
jgi:hypothetical protein